jgi:hypothetical protein
MRLAVSLCDWPYSKSCLEGFSTPAYKGVWRGHHGGTGADTIWSPRLSPIQYLVLQGIHHRPIYRSAISSCVLLYRHELPATVSSGRLSAIPPPWATLACWFRTVSLVYLLGISPTVALGELQDHHFHPLHRVLGDVICHSLSFLHLDGGSWCSSYLHVSIRYAWQIVLHSFLLGEISGICHILPQNPP